MARSPRSSWSGIRRRNDLSGVCLILDADYLRTGAVEAARAALRAGVRIFQYRDKRGSRRSIFTAAAGLAALFRDAGALFLVNDHADIALAAGAGGVHLGQDDLPLEEARRLLGGSMLIGISTHSVEQAVEAEQGGADYIGFGPLYPTLTKDAGPEKGLERLAAVRRAVALPVLAIGGIAPGNAGAAVRRGADGVAVISAVLGASDIAAACREMIEQTTAGGRAARNT